MLHGVMKKLFVSLGLAAAGTASVHAAYAPNSPDYSKMWSLAASLRGFYDDNYITGPHKQGSFGFEVNPSFNLDASLQQTEIDLRYIYGLYYYQKRKDRGQNPIDQTHQFDLFVDHAFSPLLEAKVADSVVVTQDPWLSAVGTATPERVDGNNINNTATVSVHKTWTRRFGTSLEYQNVFYSYENNGGTAADPSYTGLLDRIEQSIGLDLEWMFSRTTTGLIGYKYGQVNFTGNEPVAQNPITSAIYMSDSRDNRSHYGYVGVQHEFLENLMGQANVGVQYTTYYNDPASSSSLGPYADASLIYTYAAGSYAQIGVTQMRNATDTINVNQQGQITQDEESTVVYGSLNHPLTPKLTGSVVGHYQYSVYHDGQFNSQSSEFYNLGVNLTYAFNRHFSSDLGYNFDWYTTPVPGVDYTRNRLYFGITASY